MVDLLLLKAVAPRRAEDVDRLGEDIVVDEAGVDGEQAHQQDDVATAEEDGGDLIVNFLGSEWFLLPNHPGGHQGHDDAVAEVAEHDSEQERERDDGVRRGIHLAVWSDAIGVHQLLEAQRELVGAIVGGRRLLGLNTVQHRADGRSRSLRSTAQRQLDRFCVGRWHPALGDQAFLRYVQVEPVERMVDGLDLAHLDEPSADVFGGGDQHSVTVVLSLGQYRVQVLDAGHDAHLHLSPLRGCFRAWVESGSETLASGDSGRRSIIDSPTAG